MLRFYFCGMLRAFCNFVAGGGWKAVTDAAILAVLQSCRSELGIRRAVAVCETPDNIGPATCGILRPCIVLPLKLLDSLSHTELRLILLHELIHVRRHDVLVDKLASLVTMIHWFHPVGWFARYFLRRGPGELACDGAVLELAVPACGSRLWPHDSQNGRIVG